jgi:hypothetical protein
MHAPFYANMLRDSRSTPCHNGKVIKEERFSDLDSKLEYMGGRVHIVITDSSDFSFMI